MAGHCIIAAHALSLLDVTVHPVGDQPFQTHIHELRTAAELPAKCGDPISLTFTGDLEFAGTRTQVWMSVARDFTTRDGLVTLRKGSKIIDACERDGRVFASAVLYADDVLEGEHKPGSEVVHDVELPCDAISLEPLDYPDDMFGVPDDGTHDDEEPAPLYHYEGQQTHLLLRRKPDARYGGHVIESGAFGSTTFVELERKGEWILVEDSSEGVSVRGWIKRSLLKRDPDEYALGRSYGCWGDHDTGVSGFGFGGNAVEHEALIRVGTTMYAGDGTAPWGVFARQARIKVWITPGSLWAHVSHVDGLSDSILGKVSIGALKLDPTP